MVGALSVIAWCVAAIGAVLLLAAAISSRWLMPKRTAFALLALAEVALLVGVIVDVVGLARGQQTPDLATHIGYLLTVPLMIPAGIALTYKKIDRAGLIIVGVATLIAAIMVVRQVQTLGFAFGYINALGSAVGGSCVGGSAVGGFGVGGAIPVAGGLHG